MYYNNNKNFRKGEDIFNRILQEMFMLGKIFASPFEKFTKYPAKEMKCRYFPSVFIYTRTLSSFNPIWKKTWPSQRLFLKLAPRGEPSRFYLDLPAGGDVTDGGLEEPSLRGFPLGTRAVGRSPGKQVPSFPGGWLCYRPRLQIWLIIL